MRPSHLPPARRRRPRSVAVCASLLPALLGIGPLANAAWPQGCDDLSGPEHPIQFHVDWQTQIKPIFHGEGGGTVDCTNCHYSLDATPPLDLTDNQIDAHVKIVPAYVTPHDPHASLLFQVINCDSPPSGAPRMPLAGPKLSRATQALIYDWIEQGAFGEPEGEASPPRTIVFRDGLESTR